MSDIQIISRKGLMKEAEDKIRRGQYGRMDLVDFSRPLLGSGYADMSQEQMFSAISGLDETDMIATNASRTFMLSGKYGSGFDIPMMWGDGKTMSAREKINSGFFSTHRNPSMSGNTLPVDWTNLWDALRIDVSVRKSALPTIRENIYNITVNPNFTRQLNPTEISPFGVVFEEHNGHGQAVLQGETLGGSYESFLIYIYAAGFTWDLVAELFDRTITPERLMDAVMIGYNSKKDDLAISPILNFSYSGVQQTAASTVGTLRQELLYNTLVDAIDGLGDRNHPVTGRNLDVSNVVVLANPYDARHIAQVARGLPSVNERSYPSLSEISQVISYDGEVINLRSSSVTYSGVTKGTAYMLIPASSLPANGYMEIAVKRDLVTEIDMQPDVNTLARERRAYWFAEGIWYAGIQYFVQEITLPAW